MKIQNFDASSGWLTRFKERNGITQQKFAGEAGSVNMLVVNEGKKTFQELIAQYDLEDVFNADETGLFFKMLPDATLGKGSMSGGKVSKDRITIMVTASCTGRKLPLWVIGKSQNPRCLNHVNKENLPVVYR